MQECKRTQLYDVHVAAGASMVDFGGWEMPIQYPTGIVAEHLYTRHVCSLFDVSHMGRLLIQGPERVAFLQHVLTSNVMALDLNKAQYCIIPNENGGAVDDAYLYKFEEDWFLLVVNAANKDKDLAHLGALVKDFDCTITDISADYASIAIQGPKSKELLLQMSGGQAITEPMKNALNTLELEGKTVRVAKTGYTGEPLGYELFIVSANAAWLWNRLVELGAKPAGLGARDTLRLEAGLPLYGHEMGLAPDGSEIPIFAVPLAKFAVSFSEQKGDYVGRAALEKQAEANKAILNRDFRDLSVLPKRIQPITLLDRGVMRAGMEVYRGDVCIGWVTSGTMVPYYQAEGEGLATVILEETAKRSIGLAYIASDVLTDDMVEIDVRGKRLKAVVPACHMRADAPPFARPILYRPEAAPAQADAAPRYEKAVNLIREATENHDWRQNRCINLIPSENSASRAVQLLCASDPAFRYAEHKKVKSFYDADIFYYQGTKFIDRVEQLLVEQMKEYFGCTEVETRVISGQMSNMATFSALMDWKKVGCTQLDIAENAYQALEMLQRVGYDLVITDIVMQQINGIELSKQIRAHYSQTKVIILSAYEDFAMARGAIEAGVSQYLLKPIVSEELEHAVLQVKQEISQRQQQQSAMQESEKIVDLYRHVLAERVWRELLDPTEELPASMHSMLEMAGLSNFQGTIACVLVGCPGVDREQMHRFALDSLSFMIGSAGLPDARYALRISLA